MRLRDQPIRRKLMTIILITSGAVLLVTSAALFAYEFVTARQTLIESLATLGRITATNSTAALAFDNREDAAQILSALRSEPHIVAAGIYDGSGSLFATYLSAASAAPLPPAPARDGYRFEGSRAVGFEPIVESGSRRLGTLYVESDLAGLTTRVRLYGGIVAAVAVVSLLLAFLMSRALQRQVSAPILELAETARAITDRRDYTVRAPMAGRDEIGLFTDAFNRMLTQIDDQDQALRRSEAKFRRLAESNIIGVVIAAQSGRISEANDAFLSLVGHTRADLLAGGLDWQDITPAAWREVDAELLAQLRRQGVSTAWEKEVLRADGTAVPVLVGAAVLDVDGDRLDYVAYVLDLTARKRAEDEIKRYARELEHSNRELEQFAYVASHDLREPLRMVASYTELLQRRYGTSLDDDAREFIRFAVEGAHRMQRLIDDLLALSRVNTRVAPFAGVDMGEVMDIVRANLRAAIDESGAQVVNRSLPTVTGDATMLTQLLQNLVGNAIRFRGEQSPRVSVDAEERREDWLFRVSDNGIGIEPQHFERIFVLFQRLHRRGEATGNGIGLAVSKRIVERHGGTIWVESEPGAGSVFHFTIPKRSARA